MPYSVSLPRLIDLNLVTLRTLAPPIDPNNLPRGYDVNARCAFHSNAPGHTTNNCKALQLKVQDLRDAKAINFYPVPNVIQKPMPAHGGQRINVVDSVSADPGYLLDVDCYRVAVDTAVVVAVEE
jgi:hypothetical protein